MKDTRPLWLVIGLALGWALANPRRVTRALTWCDRHVSDVFNALRRRGPIRTSGYERRPTDTEDSAYRLGVSHGVVTGLQQAEGILSDFGESIEARIKVNPDAGYLLTEREVIAQVRRRVLLQRIQNERDHNL